MKRLMDKKWMIASFFLAALVAAVALADTTLQGKPNPYGKGVTVTVPSGTFPSNASPTTTGTMSHTGDAGITGTVSVGKILFVGSDAGVGGNLGVTGGAYVTGAATVGSTLGVTGVTTMSTDAGVLGTLGVVGDLLAAGGITVGGGSEVTAILRGTGSVWAGDAGVAEGSCEADKNVTVTGVNASAQCLVGKSEDFATAGYLCQSHYGTTNTVHIQCCCGGAANCAYVAPVTMGVICFNP